MGRTQGAGEVVARMPLPVGTPAGPTGPGGQLVYPDAPRDEVVDVIHGTKVADPYRWLEDAASARTQRWGAEQDALARSVLDGLPGRDRFAARLTELLDVGMVTSPVWRGERCFLLRRGPGQEHATLLVHDGPTEGPGTGPGDGGIAGWRVLIDPTALDPDGLTTLDAWQPDESGRLLAFQTSRGGDEESRIQILDVATGEHLPTSIDRTRYSPVAWLPDGSGFFHARRLPPDQVPAGEAAFHLRVWLHRLGTDPDTDDAEVFGAGRPVTSYYGVALSRDGRWLVVSASDGTAPRTDLWIADLSTTGPEAPRFEEVQVGVDSRTGAWVARDGRLYVLTDREAPRGRLCVADPHRPREWTTLVPEDPVAVLEDVALLDGSELAEPVVVTLTSRHAVSSVTVRSARDGREVWSPVLPGLGSVGALTTRPDGGHEAWLTYEDWVSPGQVLRLDATAGSVTTWAGPPGAATASRVVTEQVVYESLDGTPVRMFVMSPPAAEGSARTPVPTVLYGYGGFDIALAPAYSATVIAWVEAGGRYAVANLRGGSEEGEQWHRDGMREHKQHVFDDFHAAAEFLVVGGWTTVGQLAAAGGSNGGLLVGAALTQRPDRYAAVACTAPLLDMVRYELFGLGRTWNDEYGTAADPVELGWLLGYSPYHHVRPGAYPAVLFSVFESDTRVDPLHARKMCAALQAASTSGRPVLLRRERDVGHGARAVSRTVASTTDMLAFLAAHTGLRP